MISCFGGVEGLTTVIDQVGKGEGADVPRGTMGMCMALKRLFIQYLSSLWLFRLSLLACIVQERGCKLEDPSGVWGESFDFDHAALPTCGTKG